MSGRNALYLDCAGGVSGDMTVAALLDLGIDRRAFLAELEKLRSVGFRAEIRKTVSHGVSGIDFLVTPNQTANQTGNETAGGSPARRPEQLSHGSGAHSAHGHRNLHDIEQLIEASGLSPRVKERSRRIFRIVAEAEATVHGEPVEQIHFHEVGAVDSIVDIVSAAVCLEMLGVGEVYASPVHLGTGTVECAHGVLPVPVPATTEILQGVPVYATGVVGELVTPTGAAILRGVVKEFGRMPAMRVEAVGYGLGKRDYGMANVLRAVLGTQIARESPLVRQELMVLETNVDDMNPEIYSYLLPLLLEEGALDAYLTQVLMKKGRPGVQITVLCEPERAEHLQQMLLKQTTTLGVRFHPAGRSCLQREELRLPTEWGVVRFKTAGAGGRVMRVRPEYEECRRIAGEYGLALQEVYDRLAVEGAAAIRKEQEGHE